MRHRCEGLQRAAPHALGWGLGGNQIGVGSLQCLEFSPQAVVLGVRNFRIVKHIVAVVVVIDELA
jgi:hypothetical protein